MKPRTINAAEGAATPEAQAQEHAVPAQVNPELETGDVRTEDRSIYAANTSGTLLTLDDGTPFPRTIKKWLTQDELTRFSRRGLIAVQG